MIVIISNTILLQLFITFSRQFKVSNSIQRFNLIQISMYVSHGFFCCWHDTFVVSNTRPAQCKRLDQFIHNFYSFIFAFNKITKSNIFLIVQGKTVHNNRFRHIGNYSGNKSWINKISTTWRNGKLFLSSCFNILYELFSLSALLILEMQRVLLCAYEIYITHSYASNNNQ